jgi:hypothetical protein
MSTARYSYPILMKLEISRQIFEKYSSTKFQENATNGAELFRVDGQSDRHDQDNSRFSRFAKASKTDNIPLLRLASLLKCLISL